VLEDPFPVEWMGHQAVVSLPEHIDVSNAGQIREELLSVIKRGAAVLIADMTATVSCDHAGADAVARAFQRAVVNGTQLRLVVTAPVVRQVLGIEGLDRSKRRPPPGHQQRMSLRRPIPEHRLTASTRPGRAGLQLWPSRLPCCGS
jgi:anti-anti-sigma factor